MATKNTAKTAGAPKADKTKPAPKAKGAPKAAQAAAPQAAAPQAAATPTVTKDQRRIVCKVNANPFRGPLGARFQLILEGKVRTVEEYLAATLENHGGKGTPNPRKGDLRWWSSEKGKNAIELQ